MHSLGLLQSLAAFLLGLRLHTRLQGDVLKPDSVHVSAVGDQHIACAADLVVNLTWGTHAQ